MARDQTSVAGLFIFWFLYTEGKERLKKEDHFRLVGGCFNKQGNLNLRHLSWVATR